MRMVSQTGPTPLSTQKAESKNQTTDGHMKNLQTIFIKII